jgi:hypothetical protein
MIKNLLVSGIAVKLAAEARKPENLAMVKQLIADFQKKRTQPGTAR